ncbi:hypothetical protein FB451DRAFT_1184035 [Mycena latifolia]|nr:hypothetical protein FB451DRAFT_1184035 [Mycena latifolia]
MDLDTSSIADSEMELLSQNSDHESTVPSEDSALSEALDDVPAFESEAGLLAWLDVGKKQLKKLLDRMKEKSTGATKKLGSYYKTQVGAAPAARTDRLRRANAAKTAKVHGGGLMGWFTKGPAKDPPVRDIAEVSMSAGGNQMEIDPSTYTVPPVPGTSSQHPVTIEEVEDEETTLLPRSDSPTPSELSRLEEDGLGDLEEIFASLNLGDPAIHTSNQCLASPIKLPTSNPIDPGCPSVRFGLPSFSRADETFTHTCEAARSSGCTSTGRCH